MICSNCGSTIRKTDKFCCNCGEKLNPQHTKDFIQKNQSISDINVANGIIDIAIYNKNNNCGYITHRQVGIQKKEEIEKYIVKTSIPSKVPILLEKLGIEKEEGNYLDEISEISEIIGDRIIVQKENIGVVKSILYTHNVDIKREDNIIDMFILYINMPSSK